MDSTDTQWAHCGREEAEWPVLQRPHDHVLCVKALAWLGVRSCLFSAHRKFRAKSALPVDTGYPINPTFKTGLVRRRRTLPTCFTNMPWGWSTTPSWPPVSTCLHAHASCTFSHTSSKVQVRGCGVQVTSHFYSIRFSLFQINSLCDFNRCTLTNTHDNMYMCMCSCWRARAA